MALAALLSSIDSLPEALRSEYVAGDGSAQRPDQSMFYLDVTPVGNFGLEDKSGLLKTIEDLRAGEKDLKGQLKAFGNLDPKAAQDALARIKELQERGGGDAQATKAKLDSLRDQMNETFSKEKGTWDAERKEMETELSRLLIDAEVVAAMPEGGSAKLILPVVHDAVRVVKDENGKRVARVYDERGNELASRRAENNGHPMGVSEYLESLSKIADYAPAFNGSGPTGSGGTRTVSRKETQNNGGHHPVPEKPSSPAEMISAARAQSRQS